ncbi:hypothetical protein [Allosphingosinicella deserti]|nr:hypothetical protein [Sphingomonas deserti]
MRMLTKALFAAAGSLVLAGAATAAGHPVQTVSSDAKIVRVMLPDGSVQQVRYRGAVPPTLVVVPVRRVAPPISLIGDDMFAPFAMFDQIAAEMDRHMDVMLRQAAAARGAAAAGGARTGAAPGLTLTSGGQTAPAGLVSYSFSSTSVGGSTCSRSVQMVSQGEGKAPLVTEKVEGDCGAAPSVAPPAAPPAPAAPAAAAPAKPKIDHRDTI